ncbi:MAG: thiosulfohydrolase SoxB, partial [Gammaproteobacteria bacterium]
MNRRDFLQALTIPVIAAGCSPEWLTAPDNSIYNAPPFGNVTLLHFTDCHAQLMPLYYREPAVNIGVGSGKGKPPHLTGRALLDFYGIQPQSREAYAFTHLGFAELAAVYGKMGGFAYLATLINQLRAERGEANTLLLDGGDSWQGAATALWTQGRDMVSACNLL